ncbi:hypothetical protein [Pseudomonas sp. AU12215]|uniref:hypothetical protein n=1 Tax=Pseudomonas sp. AU12215 TaxID=1860123 RepID=UPI000806B5E9|nr:hypothetical protein [Pseudomonas sp. AU12215]OBY58559.1 hypothetical protein A9513_002485 [Pseudomonas sp. AU12215]
MRSHLLFVAVIVIAGCADSKSDTATALQPAPKETLIAGPACTSFAFRAGQIMLARQSGQSIQQTISDDASRYPFVAGKLVSDMIMEAYNAPVEESEEARLHRAQEFSMYYMTRCAKQQAMQ